MINININTLLEEKKEREAQARNPRDGRQSTDRYGATWGVKREGALYEEYYAQQVEDFGPVKQYSKTSGKQQLLKNAKAWAFKKYSKLNQEDISQEIELKAWLLEEHELDERGEWIRPAYVMTALKNVVHDYAEKEIGFMKANTVTSEVIQRTRFDAPSADYDIVFTNKTLKAGLMLFLAAPDKLTANTKDRLYLVYKRLSNAEHKALFQCVLDPNATANKTLDKVVAKYLNLVNSYD